MAKEFFLAAVFTIMACGKDDLTATVETFVKMFPSDSSYKTGGSFVLPNGNFVIYGFDPEEAEKVPVIIITDAQGNVLLRKMPLSLDFRIVRIKPTAAGGMMAAGVDNFFGNVHTCLMTENADPIWFRSYEAGTVQADGDYYLDFEEEESGAFTITGAVIDSNDFNVPFVLRIDADGTQLVLKQFLPISANTDLRPYAITLTHDGYVLTGAAVNKQRPYKGSFLMRMNGLDEPLWDTAMFDDIGAIVITDAVHLNAADETVVCGAYDGSGLAGRLFHQVITAGGDAYPRTFITGYPNDGVFRQMSLTQEGGLILAGSVNKLSNQDLVSYFKVYIHKLDPDLKTEWSREFGFSDPLSGVSVSHLPAPDGGYLVGGFEHTASYLFTMMMIKTDSEGNIETP